MATILRIKRRNDDEPCDAFIVSCKKQKIDNAECIDSDDVNALTAVVKFAGTVQNQEDNIVEHITTTLTKEQLTMNYKQHVTDIVNKTRIKMKQDSRDNRYKVINSYRSIGNTNIDNIDDKGMIVIDVVDSISCSTNDTTIINKCDTSYVYDLYYTQTEHDITPDNSFSICPYDGELVFDNYRDNGFKSDDNESDDSNSESNWRNDYPDSDHSHNSDNSIDDDDIKLAIDRIKIDDESSDLSSDNSTDFVYGIDENDVDNFGYKYAKYKAKLRCELGEINDYRDDDTSDNNIDDNVSDCHTDSNDDD